MSIITYPKSGPNGPSLSADVNLVRSAILYADKVELVSPTAFMLGALQSIAAAGADGILQLAKSLDPTTAAKTGLPDNSKSVIEVLENISRLNSRDLRRQHGNFTAAELAKLKDSVLSHMSPRMDELRENVLEQFIDSGAKDLVPALNREILTISSAGFDSSTHSGNDSLDNWLEVVRSHLEDPNKRLLFDAQMADLVAALVDEDRVEPNRITLRRAGEAAVGSGLIARLPTLPWAPTDELIDLRQDLSGPLANYRKAVRKLSDTLACSPLDNDYGAEIDDLWITEAAPAIERIKDEFSQHSLVRETVDRVGLDLRNVASGLGAYVSLGITSLSQLSTATAGLATTLGLATIQGSIARRNARRELKQHDLFYLYGVDSHFGK